MYVMDGDLVWPIVGAILAGAVIGAEREYRASPAGFRTHILVCLSSALLMLAAVHQIRWLTDTPNEIIRIDPVRMAHGVLTGIGFLCGGVIFREGFNVRGLTTAASLWITSALGILFGVGFYGLAVAAAVATLLVLAAVTLNETLLPQRQYADIRVCYRRDASISVGEYRATLVRHGFRPMAVSQTLDGDRMEYRATVGGFRESRVEPLAERLCGDAAVLGFEFLPHQA